MAASEYDQKATFEAMELAVLLYGRQPLAGYQQGSGRPEDDDKNALDGAGTRTHRFVIRLSKLAEEWQHPLGWHPARCQPC